MSEPKVEPVYHRFHPPKSIEEYGFNGGRPIPQEGSPSGFLLPWMAIDEHADAVSEHRWNRYVVVGETVRGDGMRFPELARLPNGQEEQLL